MSLSAVEDPQSFGDAVQPGYTKINEKLRISDMCIGTGSSGTIVLKGSYDGLEVAVKRMMSPFVRLVVHELNIIRKSDLHPNIIRYIYDTSDANFQYIALELCPASLADIMERPDAFQHIIASFVPKRALMEITSGLAHLHALRLVHRDIKPRNVLVSEARGGEHRMLISDFALCKQVDVNLTSTPGIAGWRAPEVIIGDVKLDRDGAGDRQSLVERQTQLVDIFSLGCLYYYVLTEGEHPFGHSYHREPNIMKDAKSLENLKDLVAVHAIEKMLSSKAKDRPDATTCLLHPYLWEADKMLSFLQEASNRLQSNRKGMLDELENDAGDIVGQDWRAELHPHFISHFSEKRRYNGKSVGDLLRLVRNARHHLYELPDDVRNELGMMPEGFLKYFTDRFPKLFLRVYNVVSSSSLRGEQAFESYFRLPEKSRPVLPL